MDSKDGAALALTTDQAAAAAAEKPFDKITKDGIDAKIATTDFFVRETLTVCIIEMVNGFKFVGTSACVTPANFDKDIGERIAFDNAFRQIWSHEGYLLAERQLAARNPAPAAPFVPEVQFIGDALRPLTDDEKAGLASGAMVLKDGAVAVVDRAAISPTPVPHPDGDQDFEQPGV